MFAGNFITTRKAHDWETQREDAGQKSLRFKWVLGQCLMPSLKCRDIAFEIHLFSI
jgi:hypothetical protein